jgi:hypothetical protein
MDTDRLVSLINHAQLNGVANLDPKEVASILGLDRLTGDITGLLQMRAVDSCYLNATVEALVYQVNKNGLRRTLPAIKRYAAKVTLPE